MLKGSRPTESKPIGPQDIHDLYKQGKKANDHSSWRNHCLAFLGEYPTKNGRLYNLLVFLCAQDPPQCEEFGQTAVLLLHNGKRNCMYDFGSDVTQALDRRRDRIILNHFTEHEEALSHDFGIDLCMTFIPFAGPSDLKNIAVRSNGLAVIIAMLHQCPEQCEDREDLAVGVCNFYDQGSPLNTSLTQEQTGAVKENNELLWYTRKLSKRIAVGFYGKLIWEVADIDDGNLMNDVQQKRKDLEDGFHEQLRKARKLVKDEAEKDDSKTLVDVS